MKKEDKVKKDHAKKEELVESASIVSVELDKIKGIDRQGNLFTDISEAFRTKTECNKRYKS